MKTAVGIIAIGLSLLAFLQACTLGGLSQIGAPDEATQTAIAFGTLTSLLIFFGGAFAFGMPRAASVLFFLAFLASIPAWEDFPDSAVWGGVALVLGGLIAFGSRAKRGNEDKA